MSYSLTDLPWLPTPPQDFRVRLRRAAAEPAQFVVAVRQLAGHGLGLTQLHALGQALDRWLAEPLEDGFKPMMVGLLSNGTTDILQPALGASLLRHGLPACMVGAPFDQAAQQALDPASVMNAAGCDFVLLALDHRGVPLASSLGDTDRASAAVQAALRHLEGLAQAIRSSSGATPIVQTLAPLPDALFGSLDRALPGTDAWLIDHFNQLLRERHGEWGCLLVDVAALAQRVGVDEWHDPVLWALGKFLLSQRCVPLYADWVARTIAAARGKARKCLVLDLDNTVWGGVIGDDGLAGIVLGNGSAVGEAHLEVQRTALRLRERGIVLAVSSKNDDEVARAPFRDHPEMLLKESHIAVFQANWRDKASNLQAIARALNIGVDALVLLDDNPVERAQVRQALPEVAVPELPKDPAYFSRALLAAGYFESISFTAEDGARAEQYQANAQRASLEGNTANLDEFLRSLDMRASFAAFDAIGRARITQLINKTNQFNLTTPRYSEAQVQAFEESGSGLTLQIRLADRFGDNGMISVIICIVEGQDWGIDTWLMSCRVLNRKVEQATLNEICSAAQAAGARRIVGRYQPSGRNGMVAEHYSRLGFAKLEGSAEAGSTWALEVAGYLPTEVPMRRVEAA